MKNRKLNLSQLSVKSFITKIDTDSLQGGVSACCMFLNETRDGENCYTYGHDSNCGSTGTTDDTTGQWTTPVQTTPAGGCVGI